MKEHTKKLAPCMQSCIVLIYLLKKRKIHDINSATKADRHECIMENLKEDTRMVRKIVIPHTREYTLDIPPEYLNRRIEILVLPFEAEEKAEQPPAQLRLSTFHCGGKLCDFTRGDAYRKGL